jgi:hypothetical protein
VGLEDEQRRLSAAVAGAAPHAAPATTGPPRVGAADVAALRDVLARARFTAASIQERLGTTGDALVRPTDLPAHLKRLDGDESALALLIRLFVLLASADERAVDRGLAPLGTVGLERLGLIAPPAEGRVLPTIRLVPHDELVIASDVPNSGSDHVPGVQRPSFTLANLTVRRRVGRALDLGTGNGIQALLAAGHAEHVVATDVSERALAFAAFNCALNGVENVELRRGSFLEPVRGERFDLVVANPPYVISPESSYVFRDSGLGGDRVSAELVHDLPSVLADGALATVMVSWIERGAETAAVPREWVSATGCDAWILHTRTDDALQAAASWNRDSSTPGEYTERIERWLDYYRREGIDAIAYGAIVLRRRDGENWVRAEQLPHRPLGPAGPQLERLFAAQDYLAGIPDDAALLSSTLSVADGTTLQQTLASADGTWRVAEAELRLGPGLDFAAGLDEHAARIVQALDGRRPLGDVLDELADTAGLAVGDYRTAGAALVRRMTSLGFLVPT